MYPHPSPPAPVATATPRPRFTQVPTTLLSATTLPVGARLLYGLLLAYAWQDPTCRPRQAQLAEDLAPGTSVRTVQRLLGVLRAGGWIAIARVGAHCQYTCRAPLPPGGFVQIPTGVLRDGRLSYGARVLYGLLVGYSRRAGRCFPGQDRLAADLGTPHTRTVRRLLAELAAAGLLTWTRGGRGRANCYHLLPVAPEQAVERPVVSSPARRCPLPSPRSATDSAAQNTPPPSAESDANESDPESTEDSNAPHPHVPRDVPATARRQIHAYVADLARELGDCAPLASSVSRAVNLYTGSGLSLDAFCAHLLQARRITQRYAGAVRTPHPAGEGRGKNKMPYFFAVLADKLAGARRERPSPPAPLPAGEGSGPPSPVVVRRATPSPPAPLPAGEGSYAPPHSVILPVARWREIGRPPIGGVVSPGGATENSPRCQPWEREAPTASSGGAVELSAATLSPLRGLMDVPTPPTAHAVGYSLSPLRGLPAGRCSPHPPASLPAGERRPGPAVVSTPLPYSPLIAGIALEAAQALHEARPHQAAQEALALWWESGLQEGAFVACMTQARAQTRPVFGASTPFRDALRRLVAPTPGRVTSDQ